MNKDFKTIMDWTKAASSTRDKAIRQRTDAASLNQATLYVGDTIMTMVTVLVELLAEVKKT